MCEFEFKKFGLCDDEECRSCFDKSFESHPYEAYWSDDNPVQPRQVLKNANQRYIFDCWCGHTFKCLLRFLISRNVWCPYCCKPPLQLCDKEDCEPCFEKSFASHPKAKYWAVDRNDVTPRQVFKGAHKKRTFYCDVCDHYFDKALNSIHEDPSKLCPCPFCEHKELCDDDECDFCFQNSFASHPKAECWDVELNGGVTARQVFKCKRKNCFFKCDVCPHFFDCSPDNINKGNWCPYHSNPPKRLCDDENCKECLKIHLRVIQCLNIGVLKTIYLPGRFLNHLQITVYSIALIAKTNI